MTTTKKQQQNPCVAIPLNFSLSLFLFYSDLPPPTPTPNGKNKKDFLAEGTRSASKSSEIAKRGGKGAVNLVSCSRSHPDIQLSEEVSIPREHSQEQ